MKFQFPRPGFVDQTQRTILDYLSRFFKAPEFGSPTLVGGSPVWTAATLVASALGAFPPQFKSVAMSNVTLTTAYQTIVPSQTITTTKANAIYLAIAIFDWNVTVAGVGNLQGRITVDGTPGQVCIWNSNAAINRDSGHVAVACGTLAAAGNHTFLTESLKTINAGTVNTNPNGPGLVVLVFEPAG